MQVINLDATNARQVKRGIDWAVKRPRNKQDSAKLRSVATRCIEIDDVTGNGTITIKTDNQRNQFQTALQRLTTVFHKDSLFDSDDMPALRELQNKIMFG